MKVTIMKKIRNLTQKEFPYKSQFPELYESTISTKLCNYYSTLNKNKFKDIELIIIHHLHETAYEYINALSSTFTINSIIGIPYSNNLKVIERLKEKKFNVLTPLSITEIPNLIKKAISSTKNKVVIQEIGAYSSKLIDLLHNNKKVMGVVEDTTQGHWKWEKIKPLKLPVISIANSKIKRTEDIYVAKSILDGINIYFKQNKIRPLKTKKILVLGYGNIGKKLCITLKELNYNFSVYDKSPMKQIEILTEFNFSKNFSIFDCIIGVTGNPRHSVKGKDIILLKHKSILISGSSKKVEFDLVYMKKHSDFTRQNKNMTIYKFEDKEVIVANNGEPINLKYSVVPSKILDFVYAALFFSIIKICNNSVKKGLQHLEEKEEDEIASDYIKIYQ